jgi:hypothetical protein
MRNVSRYSLRSKYLVIMVDKPRAQPGKKTGVGEEGSVIVAKKHCKGREGRGRERESAWRARNSQAQKSLHFKFDAEFGRVLSTLSYLVREAEPYSV